MRAPLLVVIWWILASGLTGAPARTTVTIEGEKFLINGRPTYAGRVARGVELEGRLLNARLVQGIFDDLNPVTRERWAYPDTGKWDPERNTREFVAAMPEWRRHGLLAFTLNLQGGSPEGYSKEQPWHNSAFEADGALRADYRARAERILDEADRLGMVVILGLFYFGQDERLADEAAVLRAVDETMAWVDARGYRHLLIEINNECNIRYQHPILQPGRVHELIERVQARGERGGWRHPVTTSYTGMRMPGKEALRISDYVLLHGNGARTPADLAGLVERARAAVAERSVPIVVNEDDHYDFEQPDNHFLATLRAGASWGYFDFRRRKEDFAAGFQSVPVDWQISSPRKIAFFRLVSELTGEGGDAASGEAR